MVAPAKFAGQKSAPKRCFFGRSSAILGDVVTVVDVAAQSHPRSGPRPSESRRPAPCSRTRAPAERFTGRLQGLLLALLLPCVALVPAAARAEQTHTVRSGQNLGVIARKYGVTV